MNNKNFQFINNKQLDKEKKPRKLFLNPIIKSNNKNSKGNFVQNNKPYPENNDPSVKKITSEKIWSLKNIQIALFIGFSLLILDLILFFALNTDLESSLLIVLTSVVIYAITLYFLLNPPYQKTIERERIRQIEKPTIKIVEKPTIRTIEKPIEKIKYIDRPTIKKIVSPMSINNDPFKKYSYVASKNSKKIHHTSTTAGRMIRPDNREFANKLEKLQKKGYRLGQIEPRVTKKI